MSRTADGLRSVLIAGETGQRALHETLEDWRDARSGLHGLGRLRCDLQGVLSVCRMLAALTAREVVTMPAYRAAATTLFIAGVMACVQGGLVSAVLHNGMAESAGIRSWEQVALALLLMPGGLAWFLPLASAFAVRNGPSAKPLGALALVLAIQLALVGWLVPMANQHYRVAAVDNFSRNYGIAPATPPLTGLSESSLGRLTVAAATDSQLGDAARRHLLSRLASLVACPLFLVLGLLARRRLRQHWRPGIANLCAGLIVTGAFIAPPLVWALMLLGDARVRESSYLRPWLMPLVATALVAVFLGRSSNDTASPER